MLRAKKGVETPSRNLEGGRDFEVQYYSLPSSNEHLAKGGGRVLPGKTNPQNLRLTSYSLNR